jgi:hypothetical protein
MCLNLNIIFCCLIIKIRKFKKNKNNLIKNNNKENELIENNLYYKTFLK